MYAPCNTCFYGSPESTTQTASRSIERFLQQLTAESHYTLQRVAPFPAPLKLPLLIEDLNPHLICGSLGQPESSTQTASRSFQLFLHSSRQSVRILYNGLPFLPQIAPSHGGIWTLPPKCDSLGPFESTNPTDIGSAVLENRAAECPYTLQWAAPYPSKLPLPIGIWIPPNTWFLEPTRVLNPNGISIG